MIILHFHQQPQFKYELFHIYFKSLICYAVKEMQDYSYTFTIKILGVPELKVNEDASETSNLCVNLFSRSQSLFSWLFSLRAQTNHLQIGEMTREK